jgi:hypothetical protein
MNSMSPSNTSPATDFSVLTPNELLSQLEQEGDRASLALMEACVTHGEAMVEALAAKIDADDTWVDCDEDSWWLPFHAALILGRIASESAGLLLLHLIRKIEIQGEEDIQDWLAGDWAALFENKPLSVFAPIRDIVLDTSLDWYVRCQGLDVMLDLGLRQGAEALDAEIDWVARLATNASDDWQFRILAASSLLDFPRLRNRSMLDSMAAEESRRGAAAGKLAGAFDLDDVRSVFARDVDEPDWRRRNSPWDFYNPDAITARQERWLADAENAEPLQDYWNLSLPHVRTEPKIGRNDPCPCGSGKKFKKCCLDPSSQSAHRPE